MLAKQTNCNPIDNEIHLRGFFVGGIDTKVGGEFAGN
jgi:hypothetical protein